MAITMFFLYLFSIVVILFSLASSFILFYGLLNVKYDLEEEKLVMRFFGIKFKEIYYSNIEEIEKLQINPYLDFKRIKNRPIKLYLKKRDGIFFNIFKIFFIYPKDRDALYENLKLKCKIQ